MDYKMDKVSDIPAGRTMTTPTSSMPHARRRLHPAVFRLLAVAILFIGWLSYLAYLVATLPHTSTGAALVLSRSQLLISEVDVIAEVNGTGPDAEVAVKEILYPKDSATPTAGEKVRVVNLALCKPLPREGEKADVIRTDWTGPGLYLLPLQALSEGGFRVAPTPPSPGYPMTGGPPRIYPGNEEAKAQYRSIKKP